MRPLTEITEQEWQRAIVAFLKERMGALDVDFADLARRLREAGVEIERTPLGNKIRRGSFGADFLLLVLAALECGRVDLQDIAKHANHGTP